MQHNTIYDPKGDAAFKEPYIDVDEWREGSVRYHYIHGGFKGTQSRFSFFFPDAKDYTGRFFHFMAPVQGSEDASVQFQGEEDKIAFAITHGAYFVESNMGVAVSFTGLEAPDIIYRASAAVAEYSREVAQKLFGPHRPYGYIYGGSGGSLKTLSCFENTDVWDGAVPYVTGSPFAMPNCFTIKAHVRRILRHKLALIGDSAEPGSDRDMYDGLNGEEREALDEILKMGFQARTFIMYRTMDDGALPILTPLVYIHDPDYFKDFWNVPGYLGADPQGSAVRDRIQHPTTVKAIYLPGHKTTVTDDGHTGVDEAWKRMRGDMGLADKPMILLEDSIGEDLYIYGSYLTFLTGGAKGYRVPLERLEGPMVVVGAGFGQADMMEMLSKVKPGDQIFIDNSDYIALQTYHRHQTPAEYYEGFEQFKDASGAPLYPQREKLIGPLMAYGGAGSVQSGRFRGKMILIGALMDESAFPWQPDWYRQKAREAFGGDESEHLRLWYMENAMHTDAQRTMDPLRTVSYVTSIYRALLELSDWVERGIEPTASTVYHMTDGQILIPSEASERKGIQPVIALRANGSQRAEVAPGELFTVEAQVEMPEGAGELFRAKWSFDSTDDFPVEGTLEFLDAGHSRAKISYTYAYETPGTYFPVIQVTGGKDAEDPFTLIRNICRVRVVVK